jgi:hypothetical protein
MIRPERRTRADIAVAVAIAVIVAAGAAFIWWTSEARATISRPAITPAPSVTPARALPTVLTQLWSAASPKTTAPVIVDGTVVSGDGHDVVGHDPVTGAQRWLFARDHDLCGVTWVYDLAVAVYPDSRGCGQVSTVDGATGTRGPTRSGFADKQVTLSSDGTTVLAAGSNYAELWRSDMVRTLAWGAFDAPAHLPTPTPQAPCTFLSAAASPQQLAMLQACPNTPNLQLVLLKVAKEDVSPDCYVHPTDIEPTPDAKMLMVSGRITAAYLPTPRPRIVIYDENGMETSARKLPNPAAPAMTVTRAGYVTTVWTGDSVMAFDAASLSYRYTVAASDFGVPIGPGVMMANRLLVPTTDGMGVFDPLTGAPDHLIAADHRGVAGPVVVGVVGSTVVEQRGNTLVALGQKA